MNNSDPFKNALQFLNNIKKNLSESDTSYLDRLLEPQNLVTGEIEIKLDNGKKKKLKAFRSQHNNALGPYKGGIRFHQDVSESEVKALALWMALKTSVAGLPLGGGKGGVIVDPKELSEKELERVSRAYMNLIAEHIGVDKDVPAPDVNTNPQVMAWMLDEYEKIVGKHQPGVLTGKPLELGGSAGRTKATGYGGFIAMMLMRKALQKKYPDNQKGWYNKPRAHVTIAVQGFGNVGYYFAEAASQNGFRIVAVSDSKGGIHVPEGLDPAATLKCKQDKGSVPECYCVDGVCRLEEGKQITNEELLELDVDVLAPSALENVIDEKNAKNVKASLILELANGPITPKADDVLAKMDTIVVPDIFANSGGVTVSYLEWVQNRMGYYWKEQEVDDMLEELMGTAFKGMWDKFNDLGDAATMRQAAYILAVERIIEAERLRRPL